ncbi:Glutamate 5-kinase [Candidatus Methanoperedenaceae archaeon GB50]|nr:MAG: Glutamate 5-kinase [Candidatus Methanoperedenaceae archaeon GB50]CAD7772487.1 Glutamate 5-kinase [Candidatus Methanoperedenaceae archaeon GB37]CAD7772604.1 Glutamate 5-kinase [Candidatus Methanoperedenaceae archaeon GB50]
MSSTEIKPTEIKRIVVKIGTNTLSDKDGLRYDFIKDIARQVSHLKREGKEVIIVTSGAIGAGCKALNLMQRPQPTDIILKQACAAVGQSVVMEAYHNAFASYNEVVAQILLTYDDFSDRKKYLNFRNGIEKLLKLGVIPVVNENDVVATDEIKERFGDNDRLSALLSSGVDADLLIMLSDVDGLYDRDPKIHRDARLITTVPEITREIEAMAGEKGSPLSVGGMVTKIGAAKICADAGCRVVITNGNVKNVVTRIVGGERIGTLFLARKRLSKKEMWISHSTAKGRIIIDDGAKDAILKNKSLLPSGIVEIKGMFEKNDVVFLNDFAKAIVDFSSEDLKKIKGKNSSEIKKILNKSGKVIVKSENIVFL